jgi:hypothetical protein
MILNHSVISLTKLGSQPDNAKQTLSASFLIEATKYTKYTMCGDFLGVSQASEQESLTCEKRYVIFILVPITVRGLQYRREERDRYGYHDDEAHRRVVLWLSWERAGRSRVSCCPRPYCALF